MTSNTSAFYAQLERNEQRNCNDRACDRKRDRISGYCAHHTLRVLEYGHPRGRFLHPLEWTPERLEVRKFIKVHIDHPAITAALKLIGDHMERCWRGEGLGGHKDWQRLHEHGVTPQDVLEAAAAIWLFSTRTTTLPDDARLTYHLGLAALELAPRRHIPSATAKKGYYRKRHSGKARREFGEFLRGKLAPVLSNIARAIGQVESEAAQREADLRKPFV